MCSSWRWRYCYCGNPAALRGSQRADFPCIWPDCYRHVVLPARRSAVGAVDPRRHDQLEAARHDRRHNVRAVSPAGTVLIALMPHALDRSLVLGVLFLRALPSTAAAVHRVSHPDRAGNVAGAVCAAMKIEPDGDGIHAVAIRLHVRHGTRRRRGRFGDVAGVRRVAAAVRPRPSATSVDWPMGGAKQVSVGDHRPWLDPDRGLHRVRRRPARRWCTASCT